MAAIQLFFLHHSGFAVETPSKILVFDYWRDPAGVVSQLEKTRKPLWFFVSHRHEDHFNPQIAAFQQKTAHYIVNEEVPLAISASEKMQRLRVYDTIVIDDVTITQYGSTDEGGSFYVRTDGIQLFHAGDLNRWHWNGDTVQNNDRAKENFIREMQHLSGLTTDFAFFPVDARLESAREWGVSGFLQVVKVRKALIPMHYFGSVWQPSATFVRQYGHIPLWIPKQAGDTRRWLYGEAENKWGKGEK